MLSEDFVFSYGVIIFVGIMAVFCGSIIYSNSFKQKMMVAIFQTCVLGMMIVVMVGMIFINVFFIIKDTRIYSDKKGIYVVTVTTDGHIIRSDKPFGIVGDTVFIGSGK